MSAAIKTLYPVRDLAAAKTLFGHVLGVEPMVDEPYYVGYEIEGRHVGLVPNGHSNGMTGQVTYWPVADIKASLATLLESGATLKDDATNVGGGNLVATVEDADGNVIGLIQPAG
jgi:predicted enzyme related to lactoylglutathione lyase